MARLQARRSASVALIGVVLALLSPALALLHFHTVPHARSEASGRLLHLGYGHAAHGCEHGEHHEHREQRQHTHQADDRVGAGEGHAGCGAHAGCAHQLYLASHHHVRSPRHLSARPGPSLARVQQAPPALPALVTLQPWLTAPKNSPPQA